VQPFPDPQGKWQISNAGGLTPRWRPDGKELFYITPENLYSVAVTTAPRFEAGAPRLLFLIRAGMTHGLVAGDDYAVGADGNRFLIHRPKEVSVEAPITVVLNWPALLEK